jgi:hypothetical protein
MKFRIIHDLSFPEENYSSVHYGSIENTISFVRQFGNKCPYEIRH